METWKDGEDGSKKSIRFHEKSYTIEQNFELQVYEIYL